ncbi:MDP1 [Symbiodinium natans]|uniref:MDP1 protein n=1 Tax=Symbiodinium natans TaxID=878477 RepID=A0A812R076_9DINO|nr:MDP1 [Symbiodinium natans]
MYMIRKGAPFSTTADPSVLKASGGQAVQLLGNIRSIWKELHSSPGYANTRVGVASRCDHPDWGRECLRKFMIEDGVSMWDVAEGGELVEIFFSSKREHFRRLAAKTGVAFEDMLFFDDDPSNIQDVSQLGVTCIETPEGVTAEAWEEGLKQHSKRKADASRRAC